MVAQYTVAGRQVGSHVLALATLGVTGAIVALSMGGSKATKTQGPPIKASSDDEEKFIRDFMKSADAEEARLKH